MTPVSEDVFANDERTDILKVPDRVLQSTDDHSRSGLGVVHDAQSLALGHHWPGLSVTRLMEDPILCRQATGWP